MPDTDDIVRDVKAFYQNFIDGFNRGDTDLYLSSFCYPNTILSAEQGLSINAQASDQQGFYQSVRDDIQQRGWDHTGVPHMQAWPLADEMALFVETVARPPGCFHPARASCKACRVWPRPSPWASRHISSAIRALICSCVRTL
jgi:hypothetical protein